MPDVMESSATFRQGFGTWWFVRSAELRAARAEARREAELKADMRKAGTAGRVYRRPKAAAALQAVAHVQGPLAL